jgi:hypothetical protein
MEQHINALNRSKGASEMRTKCNRKVILGIKFTKICFKGEISAKIHTYTDNVITYEW